MTTSIVKDIIHFVEQLSKGEPADLDPKVSDVKGHAKWLIKRLRKEEAATKEEDTLRIEINFPVSVYISDRSFHRIVETISEVCDDYENRHPGRTMWPAGMGSKITYMPMTREEEKAGRHMEFAKDVLCVDVAEREDYSWPCKKCNKEQGDHKHCLINPPAGDCDFEPADTKPTRRIS